MKEYLGLASVVGPVTSDFSPSSTLVQKEPKHSIFNNTNGFIPKTKQRLSRLVRHVWLEGRDPILTMLYLQTYPRIPAGEHA